jgi:alanine racemase
MDMTMIDLTDLAEAHINDEVVLMGTQNEEKISAEELAKLGNTIPYEIFCGISKRMPRIYLDR